MTYETIIGPLSRIVCCFVPFAWLPALIGVYLMRRNVKTGDKHDRSPNR